MAAMSFISPFIVIAFVFFLRSYLLEIPKFDMQTSKYWSDKFLVSETHSFMPGFKVSLPGADTWHIRRRFSNARVPYSTNNPASFNTSLRSRILSGDVHPLPGPEMTRDQIKSRHRPSECSFSTITRKFLLHQRYDNCKQLRYFHHLWDFARFVNQRCWYSSSWVCFISTRSWYAESWWRTLHMHLRLLQNVNGCLVYLWSQLPTVMVESTTQNLQIIFIGYHV